MSVHSCQGPLHYVSQQSQVEALAQNIEPGISVALDTEADSLHHYYEKVCLIQLSFGSHHYIVDPLAKVRVEPLLEKLAQCTLVIHGADYDLRMLRRQWGFEAHQLFDTMCAAQLLGYEELGLASLVKRCCGVTLCKSGQRADWSRRPLSPKLIEYATNDSRYLLCVAERLEHELRIRGRVEWHREMCQRILENVKCHNTARSEARQWRVKGWHTLKSSRAHAILRELWQWREREAQHADLPPFRILGNEMLVRLAAWTEATSAGDALPDFIPPHLASSVRRLESLRRAVEHARALPPEKWPRPSHVNCKQAPKPSKSLCEELKACRDEIAAKYDVPPQLITPSTALLEIAAARPHTCEELKAVSKLCNWQVELIGEPFLRIIRAHEHASDVSPASSNLFD
ncbi:MAG: HRDC domain-containing protein [Candidatus Sumerlaea chitinivorans]|nr:HRDC domain-containing protein [Candidatus Sumerlaea chitinivorans]